MTRYEGVPIHVDFVDDAKLRMITMLAPPLLNASSQCWPKHVWLQVPLLNSVEEWHSRKHAHPWVKLSTARQPVNTLVLTVHLNQLAVISLLPNLQRVQTKSGWPKFKWSTRRCSLLLMNGLLLSRSKCRTGISSTRNSCCSMSLHLLNWRQGKHLMLGREAT